MKANEPCFIPLMTTIVDEDEDALVRFMIACDMIYELGLEGWKSMHKLMIEPGEDRTLDLAIGFTICNAAESFHPLAGIETPKFEHA